MPLGEFAALSPCDILSTPQQSGLPCPQNGGVGAFDRAFDLAHAEGSRRGPPRLAHCGLLILDADNTFSRQKEISSFQLCLGHGGQLIVLVEDLDMVVVTTSYPFWLEHNDQSWKHEKAIMSMVSEFVASLPGE